MRSSIPMSMSLVLFSSLAVSSLVAQPIGQPRVPPGTIPIYRLYMSTGEPLFTDDPNEVATLVNQGQARYEGAKFLVATTGGPGRAPLYRLVYPQGPHLLDTTRRPRNHGRARVEKQMGFVSTTQKPTLVPLHEWVRPDNGYHLYTTDPRGEIAPLAGYRYSRIVGYVMPWE